MSIEMMIYLSYVVANASGLFIVTGMLFGIAALIFGIIWTVEPWEREELSPNIKKMIMIFVVISFFACLIPNEKTINKIIAIKIARETPVIRIAVKAMNWLENKADNVMAEKP